MTGRLTAGERLAPSNDTRPGKPQAQVPERVKKTRRRRGFLSRAMRGLFGASLALLLLVGVVGGAVFWVTYERFSADLPDVDGLRNYQPPVMSRVYAGDRALLTELATERRIFVPITAVPESSAGVHLGRGSELLLAPRDRSARDHPCGDLRSGAFRPGKRPIGASTITQQVAKNMLLDSQVSIARKAREAILAMRIEQNLSKDRILELYLNEIYLGLGSYGVAAAAQSYFNKSLDKLTVAEAAFLAALPKAPNNLNPFKYPEAARQRRDYVLDRLQEDRAITAAQATAAKAEPIVPSEFRRPPPIPGADWFAEEVRRQLTAGIRSGHHDRGRPHGADQPGPGTANHSRAVPS